MINDPEVIVLSGLLENPKWIVTSKLRYDDFRSPEHRLIYIAISKYHFDSVDIGNDLYANKEVTERWLNDNVKGKARKLLPQSLNRLRSILKIGRASCRERV